MSEALFFMPALLTAFLLCIVLDGLNSIAKSETQIDFLVNKINADIQEILRRSKEFSDLGN